MSKNNHRPFSASKTTTSDCLQGSKDDGWSASCEIPAPSRCPSLHQSSWQPARIQTRQRSSGSLQERKKVLQKPVFAILFIRYSLASFPNDYLCRISMMGFLSCCEENISSVRDGFSDWVKADPASILKRHLVNAKSANPDFRESPDRKHSPTIKEYRFDAPNRLTEQKRLSIHHWIPGPRRGKEEATEKHIAGKWHIIALQSTT